MCAGTLSCLLLFWGGCFFCCDVEGSLRFVFSLVSAQGAGIVAEAPPVADEVRRGWRSGQNRSAPQAERFWEPQEGLTFVGCDKSKQKHACACSPKALKITALILQ